MNNSGRDIGTGLHVAYIYAHYSHNINSLATQTAKRSRLGISRAILVAVYIYHILLRAHAPSYLWPFLRIVRVGKQSHFLSQDVVIAELPGACQRTLKVTGETY